MTEQLKLLVIGLGNPLLGDDGVGWRVVEFVEQKLHDKSHPFVSSWIEFEYLSLGGLSLMERMEGYKSVIVVDSILTGTKPIGTIYSLPLSNLPNLSAGHTTAVHDTSLATALEVGKRMGMVLPKEVWVVAVEAEQVFHFSENLSPEIEDAVPIAADIVIELLENREANEKILFP
ncbi:MAG: hydrogenase maturation protease [Aliifodinibius sp.]|nr:hydrogenase maturation protease [Fodinibius sp.]